MFLIVFMERKLMEYFSYLDDSFSFEQMQPSLPKRGKIVFDVPENIKGMLEISSSSFWSDEKKYVSWT